MRKAVNPLFALVLLFVCGAFSLTIISPAEYRNLHTNTPRVLPRVYAFAAVQGAFFGAFSDRYDFPWLHGAPTRKLIFES